MPRSPDSPGGRGPRVPGSGLFRSNATQAGFLHHWPQSTTGFESRQRSADGDCSSIDNGTLSHPLACLDQDSCL